MSELEDQLKQEDDVEQVEEIEQNIEKKSKKDKKHKKKKKKHKKDKKRKHQQEEEQIEENQVRKRDKKKKEKIEKKVEVKQKKRVEEYKIKQEELMNNFSDKQKEAYLKIQETQKKPNRKGQQDEQNLNVVSVDLQEKMRFALDKDRMLNEQQQPALNRLNIISQVQSELRKKQVQDNFLTIEGCKILHDWLDIMPDGTFPNVNLVESLLQCINNLDIEPEFLQEADLIRVVQYYADGIAKMPIVRNLAKSILDKWQRIIYNINTDYDAEGRYDTEYKQLLKKLDDIKERNVQNKNQQEQRNQQENDDEEEIVNNNEQAKSRGGLILPDKNAFDFIERPEPISNMYSDKKLNNESGKAKLQKKLLQLKKQHSKGQSNKGMSTVKNKE